MQEYRSTPEYHIKPITNKFVIDLKELWQYKELFYFFTWRDIKVKYKQTLLGFCWAVLRPLLMMLVFVFFFSKNLNIPTDNIPAPLFYFSGLLLWNLFSSGLNTSANSMVVNAEIIKKIYFPRLVIPLSCIFVALFDFIMALLIYLVLLLYYQIVMPSLQINANLFWLLPLALFITLITTIGIGCTVAALNVQYRDFRYIIPFLIQLLLFLTPVIYPLSIFEELSWAKYLLAINPLTAAIMLLRSGFEPTAFDGTIFSIGIFSAAVWFFIGIYTFKRMEGYFADIA